MQVDEVKQFYLVGGTALALHLGHRKSFDLDFFIHTDFNSEHVAQKLQREFHAKNIETGKNLVRCVVSKVKLEFISHQYPLLEKVQEANSIRIANVKDLSAFKINAIVNRGAKKDFWDLAVLLEHLELSQILDFYSTKYKNHNLWQVEKSLCYFKDADEELTEIISLTDLNWETVKHKISEQMKKHFKDYL